MTGNEHPRITIGEVSGDGRCGNRNDPLFACLDIQPCRSIRATVQLRRGSHGFESFEQETPVLVDAGSMIVARRNRHVLGEFIEHPVRAPGKRIDNLSLTCVHIRSYRSGRTAWDSLGRLRLSTYWVRLGLERNRCGRFLSLYRPITGIDLDGRPRHVDVVVILIPTQLQIPSRQVGDDGAIAAVVKDCGNADRRGAGPARLGQAAATLPRAPPLRTT